MSERVPHSTSLTGVDQIIGNWPGKTVERAEGLLLHKGHRIRVIDLPGIYSFSTYSNGGTGFKGLYRTRTPRRGGQCHRRVRTGTEPLLYHPVDGTRTPDAHRGQPGQFAEKKGISVDTAKLSALLGVPVIPTIATRGKGIDTLSDGILNLLKDHPVPPVVTYGKEVEEQISRIDFPPGTYFHAIPHPLDSNQTS